MAGTNHQPVLGLIFITLAVCSFLAVGPVVWPTPRRSLRVRQPRRASA
ncbi:major facilitator protein [Arthrobacter sp. Hiyo8]|nr:major facilitator protein [Arthrobacter sp. Hiyo8]